MELKLLKIVLAFALGLSVFISINKISYWGLSYDEALFINGAIHKDNITFISKRYHGLVLMVFQYIGALKSWLYIPIFKLFSVNLLSIRLPMLIILYINYFLIFVIAKKYFNLKIVLALMIILLTDLSYIQLHKIDNGPNALETLLKLFSLYVITRTSFRGQNVIVLLLLALGIFNKLNFIWFVNAFYFTLFTCASFKYFSKENNEKNVKNLHLNKKITHLVNYAVLISFFVYLVIKQNVQSNIPTTWNILLSQFYSQMTNIVNAIGNFTYENYFGWTSNHQYSFVTILILLAFVFLGNIYFIVKNKIDFNDPHFYLLIFLFILICQLILTKEAFHLWHILILYPFIHLLILNTFSIIFNKNHKTAVK